MESKISKWGILFVLTLFLPACSFNTYKKSCLSAFRWWGFEAPIPGYLIIPVYEKTEKKFQYKETILANLSVPYEWFNFKKGYDIYYIFQIVENNDLYYKIEVHPESVDVPVFGDWIWEYTIDKKNLKVAVVMKKDSEKKNIIFLDSTKYVKFYFKEREYYIILPDIHLSDLFSENFNSKKIVTGGTTEIDISGIKYNCDKISLSSRDRKDRLIIGMDYCAAIPFPVVNLVTTTPELTKKGEILYRISLEKIY